MSLVNDDALILQAFAYSESSKILRLLTRGHGLVSVMARGARRPKSRYGGLLEPFTQGVATYYHKESRELQTLSGFDLVRSGQALGRDLLRFGGASTLAEIVLLAGSAQPDAGLFERVRDALDRITAAPPASLEPLILAELWGLTARLGFAPATDFCQSCGRAIEPAEDTAFDYAAGGVRCRDCPGAAEGRPFPAHARAALEAMLAGDARPIDRPQPHWLLLDRFLTYHLLEGRTLRSMRFIADALEPGA